MANADPSSSADDVAAYLGLMRHLVRFRITGHVMPAKDDQDVKHDVITDCSELLRLIAG
jgi:hypothetical protein